MEGRVNRNKCREIRRKLETHWQSATDRYEERQVGGETVRRRDARSSKRSL